MAERQGYGVRGAIAAILLASGCAACSSTAERPRSPGGTGFGALSGMSITELSGEASWDSGPAGGQDGTGKASAGRR